MKWLLALIGKAGLRFGFTVPISWTGYETKDPTVDPKRTRARHPKKKNRDSHTHEQD